MNRQKSETRIAVENAIREHATKANPLKSDRIAELAGVNLTLTRHHIGVLVGLHMVKNMGERATSAYAWMQRKPAEIAPSVSRFSTQPYTGEKAGYTRPEGQIAYQIPSLVGGECVERKRPILNGGSLA